MAIEDAGAGDAGVDPLSNGVCSDMLSSPSARAYSDPSSSFLNHQKQQQQNRRHADILRQHDYGRACDSTHVSRLNQVLFISVNSRLTLEQFFCALRILLILVHVRTKY